MAVASLLQRLRPVGAPGAAGPVAVPVQDEDSMAAELAPVFDVLSQVEAECHRIRSIASETAATSIAEAERDGTAWVAEARLHAPADRAAAAAEVHSAGGEAARSIIGSARAEAEELTERAQSRINDLAGRVVADLRTSIASAAGEDLEETR